MKASQREVLTFLKTVRGQVEGLIKMVEDDKYCLDISNQLLASKALINKTNQIVLKAHLNHCIKEALEKGNQDKIDEVLKLLEKISKTSI